MAKPKERPAASPKELVTRAALRSGLPPNLSTASRRWSRATDRRGIPKGAIGLMQLMPETARRLNADPADPEQNADAGAVFA
jgi:soluble lytic murein transglycosylase-like protein